MRAAVLVVATVLAVAAGAASAQPVGGDFADRWSVGARAGIVASDRSLRRDGDLVLASFGRTFGPEHALEIEGFRERSDSRGGEGLRNRGVAINLLTINREPLWDPYFLVGLGAMRVATSPGQPARRETVAIAQVAIGGQWELVLPERVLLRAELRMRVGSERVGPSGQEGYGDGTLSVGLTIPF
jgi:hypothetical protein